MALDPITGGEELGVAIISLVSKFIPDKTIAEQEAFALEIQKLTDTQAQLTAQSAVDAAEAANPSIFVAGWRPWIGWGLGTILIFYAFLTLVSNEFISLGYQHIIPFPPLDPMVRDIVLGLLGLNISARSYEKVNQADTKKVGSSR